MFDKIEQNTTSIRPGLETLENKRDLALKGKRIVLAVGSLEMGGAERQLLLLAEYLKQHCLCQVTVAGIGEPRELADVCQNKGIDWVSLPIPLDKNAGVIPNIKNLTRFRRSLRQLKPEIILSYTPLINVGCALVWRFCSAKACIWNQRDAGLGLERIKYRFLLRLSSFYVSNSEHAAEMLKGYSIPEHKITVIHNGIDVPERSKERAETLRAQMSLDTDSQTVCMIGNIHPLKDHITLVKAWNIVVKKCAGHKPVLLLAGCEYDSYSLRQLIAEYGLDGSIRILGHVRDINGLLEAVDIACFSSHTEGFPNGVLEPMAMGLPVAATDLPGIREVIGVDSQQLAWPRDPEDMAQKIINLIENENLSRQIGQRNLHRVQQCFPIEAMGQQYVNLLMKLCK